MNNPKQLGAEAMFDQSIIYLYNSFREEGYSKEEASKMVADKIEQIYYKYATKGIVQSRPKTFRTPEAIVDSLIKHAETLKNQLTGPQKYQADTLWRGLIEIRALIKK